MSDFGEQKTKELRWQPGLAEATRLSGIKAKTVARLEFALKRGAEEYEDKSFDSSPYDIRDEMKAECLDFIGWGTFLLRHCKTGEQKQALGLLFKSQESIADVIDDIVEDIMKGG